MFGRARGWRLGRRGMTWNNMGKDGASKVLPHSGAFNSDIQIGSTAYRNALESSHRDSGACLNSRFVLVDKFVDKAVWVVSRTQVNPCSVASLHETSGDLVCVDGLPEGG